MRRLTPDTAAVSLRFEVSAPPAAEVGGCALVRGESGEVNQPICPSLTSETGGEMETWKKQNARTGSVAWEKLKCWFYKKNNDLIQ